MKEWVFPLKAHLRGAIALINSRRAKSSLSSTSFTIYRAVETQIVCHILSCLSSCVQLTIA